MNLGELGPSCVLCGREQGHETCVERRVIALLTEIRDALVPVPAIALTCTHEDRLDFSSMGEIEWVCKNPACRFHYGPVQKG